MREKVRSVALGLALLAAAVIIWSLGRGLLDLTDAMISRIGPIWTIIVLGGVSVALGALWLRWGGAGALGRWGVTIRPALPSDPQADPSDDAASERTGTDLPRPAGRRPGPPR
jgi:hypothetical protein